MELNQWSPDEVKKQVVKTEGYWIYYSDGSKCMDIQSGNTAFVLGYSDL
jgi:adenosylmethionine-8-amino-7-oxononanoate aminotransferase